MGVNIQKYASSYDKPMTLMLIDQSKPTQFKGR